MTPERIKSSELDRIMHDALASREEFTIPYGLTDNTIRRLEKKAIFRELLVELAIKTGLVLSSLVILAGVFLWTNGSSFLLNLWLHLSHYGIFLIPLLLSAGFILLIDQVGLRLYDQLKKTGTTIPIL
jgi:hypothetical protein